ncbi:unnamed protein product [Soboliphyme baturini]|uniref:Uncharacterized protein n=1 Tax=Soboliphyme baturini TaxID=241478 RepID=A0A183J0E0_9BILA|nr:unnamed protein product [Soboliphyme baturini]
MGRLKAIGRSVGREVDGRRPRIEQRLECEVHIPRLWSNAMTVVVRRLSSTPSSLTCSSKDNEHAAKCVNGGVEVTFNGS